MKYGFGMPGWVRTTIAHALLVSIAPAFATARSNVADSPDAAILNGKIG